MTEIAYPYGRALVAESGAVLTSAKAVEYLGQMAKDKTLFDERGMAGVAAQAIRKVRNELRYQQFDCSAEELQDFIYREELNCELMIAHDHGGPCIESISLTIGIANRTKHFFDAVGSGADLAMYLLSDLCLPEMNYSTAAVVAAYVVEAVKRHDPYCGGPVKLGILRLPKLLPPTHEPSPLPHYYSPPILLSQSEADELVTMALEVEQATKTKRVEIIREALKKKARRVTNDLLKGYSKT